MNLEHPISNLQPRRKSWLKLWPLAALILGAVVMSLTLGGCGTPHLEPGGAYAPGATNAAGVFVPSQQADPALYIADASYKLAYDAIDAVLKFERDNRAQLLAVSPKIKAALDAIRPKVVDIDRRWALARQAYQAHPVAANLDAVQRVLAEIQQLVPVVQSQLNVK